MPLNHQPVIIIKFAERCPEFFTSKGVLVTLKSYQDSPSFQVKITSNGEIPATNGDPRDGFIKPGWKIPQLHGGFHMF